jgi:hypothetical protein
MDTTRQARFEKQTLRQALLWSGDQISGRAALPINKSAALGKLPSQEYNPT